MATVRTTSRETGNQREKTIAIQFSNENEQRTSRIRDAMILLAIVMLGTAVGTHAFAAGRMGGGVGFSGGFGTGHVSGGSHSPVFNGGSPPVFNVPVPVFNPSEPHTVPQSPETPVSPASPESVFGNG
jgi:hypothetical protein